MRVELRLFATLRDSLPPENRGVERLELTEDSTVDDVINQLQLPRDQIAVIMINGKKVALDTVLKDNDRLGIFPPVGGG